VPSARPITLVALVAGGGGGVARYARMLVPALDRVNSEYDLRVSLLTTPATAERLEPLSSISIRLPGAASAFRRRPLVENIAASFAPRTDMLHFFDLVAPLFLPFRDFTTTVHDAAAVHYRMTPMRRWYRRAMQPWAVRRAEAVIAVSSFAAEEAIRHLGADRSRVHVAQSGPGLVSGSPEKPSIELRQRPYLLYVGGLAENKKVDLLVRAFDRSAADADLVLVGRPAEGWTDLQRAIAQARAHDRITVMPDASDSDVDLLYRNALALLLPSEYEGFGFTPLEAMARDCPALASDIPAVREVSGTGALLVAVNDELAWSEAIARVVADEELRAELRVRGQATVMRYSWEKTARRLFEIWLSLPPAT